MLVDWNLKNFWKKDLAFEQANSPENPGEKHLAGQEESKYICDGS